MWKLLTVALAATLALGGCADDGGDRGPGDGAAADTGTAGDGAFPMDALAGEDAGPDASADGGPDAGSDAGRDSGSDAGSEGGLHIEFDYRFDTAGFFTDPARRAVLEAAATAWGQLLVDDFEDIPVGTSIRTRDPESPTAGGMSFPSDRPIDDVLIFVGCASFAGGTAQSNNTAALASVADTALAGRLRERYEGGDFEPWTGWISFHCDVPWYYDATPETDADIPGDQNDFYSTALHEIGHVLGFGTADAYFALVSAGDTFIGADAVAAFGAPVPLTSSGVHFQSSVRSDGRPTLMDPSRTIGTRTPPTSVDRAVMRDLGYESAAGAR